MITLFAIQEHGKPGVQDAPLIANVCDAMRKHYGRIGFFPPWIGYLAYDGGRCIGTCGFKYPPDQNKVEIAYFTFPDHEGQGYATLMAQELVTLARRHVPGVRVTARTLPQRNASARVLEKNGFVLAGEVDDPEDGVVWEWWVVTKIVPGFSQIS